MMNRFLSSNTNDYSHFNRWLFFSAKYFAVINSKNNVDIGFKTSIIVLGGEQMKREVLLTTSVKVQEAGTNIFITLPSTVRTILKAKKTDEVEYVIYDDKSIEIRMKE